MDIHARTCYGFSVQGARDMIGMLVDDCAMSFHGVSDDTGSPNFTSDTKLSPLKPDITFQDASIDEDRPLYFY